MAHLMQTRRERSWGDRGEQGGITQWLPTREVRVHVNRHYQVSGVTRSFISEYQSPSTCHVLYLGKSDVLYVLVLHLRLEQKSTVDVKC